MADVHFWVGFLPGALGGSLGCMSAARKALAEARSAGRLR
jgi:hypothetical protein